MFEKQEESGNNPLDDKELVYSVTDIAMWMLVFIAQNVEEGSLDDSQVTFNAANLLDVLELFIAYVDRHEDINLNELMESVDIDLQATIMDSETPRIH